MAKTVSITELPPSPDHERHMRMIKYAVAMTVRVICLIAVLFVPGWWRLIPAIAAAALPYFAVVIANNVHTDRAAAVERPGGIVPVGSGAGAGGQHEDMR
ncbi:hypothetical protein GCM10009840_21720 [Pseudolysinimonas kribbensis]|uniref:DUF3099 domain-containing protein n=1 Tax=Pseudolysinimonas kribbensis TaxID=433641 RepID=A0ABQ6KC13_9MICO|nr:DUF3099 domain-containing protein [Pseudolysinimonas kribbensis]GMA93202.1 hypothetical protein GCM10025881_00260 [Pseudolysinimonas kribbensis]GMA97111.1 hypothetical protein GCM10025881_39350 [Pseudolysinimonas kribbensis]